MTTREVVLDGGSPWGFRLHGGADVNQPLRISRVNPGSKAALRGIREGDFITSINNQSTKDISNAEAHALLRNSGDTLKLGLNEDYNGSPKRRQYKTVHQETHSETVKKSSVTSYTLTSSKTVSQSEINDKKPSKVNGTSTTNGDSIHDQTKNPVASQRSTLSSNCSSSSSTPSTYTDPLGTASCHQADLEQTTPHHVMSDNVTTNARSRRKRSRNRRKSKNNGGNTRQTNITTEVIEEEDSADVEIKSPDEYHVEYPNTTKKTKTVIKSKSLDDDELIKIQELSEVSSGDDKSECKAIVSEAESDVEWEVAATMEELELQTGVLSSLSLPLGESYTTEQVSLISPEEELTLRNFLEGLNLVNSPEDAVKHVHEASTIESVTSRRARKRAALELYFTPIIQNPRFLDVINEETGDLSDREQQSITHHLKQGTPEPEFPPVASKPPSLPKKRLQSRMQSHFIAPITNPTILVGTKIIDVPTPTQEVRSSSDVAQTSCKAEVVYLEDSSNSSTPDPRSDNEDEDKNINEDVLSSNNSSVPDLLEKNNNEEWDIAEVKILAQQEDRDDIEKKERGYEESELVEEKKQVHQVNRDIVEVKILAQQENRDNIEKKERGHEESELVEEKKQVHQENKDNIEEMGQVCEESEVVEEKRHVSVVIRKNNVLISSGDHTSCERTCSIGIASQLTPPPTPVDIFPKCESVTVAKTDEDVDKKDELNKEVENICANLNLPESIVYTNVLSPPAPSPSLSSGSSSRATSLCTAKYNPMNSSIADMDSISADEEFLKNKVEFQPLTLRELCLNFLMSQPFGADVLQELAEVSQSLDHLTNNILTKPAPNLPAFLSKPELSVKTNNSLDVPVMRNWVGLPTEEDSRLLVCLSPTQKSELEKSRRVADEAAKLLDLHEKYIYRSSYHDGVVERRAKNEVEITSIKDESSGNNVSNRLLAIIRDEPTSKLHNQEEKRSSATLPRSKNMESARLNAKDLTEWLQLARNKSTSETNLTELKDSKNSRGQPARRTSLPQNFYDQQMRYLEEKEREIQKELEYLEEEKRKLTAEMAPSRQFQVEDFHISKKGDFAEIKKARPLSMPAVSSEFFRQQMYEEYMGQIAAREERKQHKVIKVTSIQTDSSEIKSATGIEDEFMDMVKQKQKLGKLQPEEEESGEKKEMGYSEETKTLPKHLQEFLDITNSEPGDGVWSPGQKQEKPQEQPRIQQKQDQDEPISPVWTPRSATSSPTVERKEFRPVKFESPTLSRKHYSRGEEPNCIENSSKEPPWKAPETSSDTGTALSSTLQKRLPTSHSSPASGFNDFSTTSRLPRAQNPTITLLQKAREGQLPKGASYIEQDHSFKRSQNGKPPLVGPGEILYKIKNEYTSESDSEKPRKMADLGPRKFEGIGPTTRDGMPLILRSEVKDANQSKWYKKMYDTIHKQRPHRDEYVTVRYKQRRGQYPYSSGYLSEPEPGAYDSDFTDYKYATLDRRRIPARDKENDYIVSSTMPRNTTEHKSIAEVIKHGHDPYKNQPGRIEHYIPGHSSISEKEAKEWWDEVMDIFDGHLEQQKRVPQTKSFINQALKESGYESDSTLVFRRRDDTAQQLSPAEQKEAYKIIQKGGDVPLHGLRKPAPERPKEPEPPVPPPKGHHGVRNLQQESPRKYVENEVTIHYKTPVRQEIKEYLSEDELAYRQAEAMKKIYQEERRRKYLQELQDMNNRRHTDNFIPSQKSPIPLNRYDDFDDLSPPVKPRPRSPEPRLLARALYNFVGQTARELTFRKGDLIYVRRQVDKNWYEGELNAMVGLFPVNYVEIVTYDTAKSTPRKSHEGQARAKYNFVAQTHLELSLAKGELVVITRRVDDNWFEGKIGGRKGIFPVSYVEVLIDPSDPPPPSSKPVAAPAAHSLLLNGSAGGKESMGSHSYTPNISSNQLTSSYHAKPVQITTSGNYTSLSRPNKNSVGQALHIETQSEPIPYRALYKYLPQNDDELELLEGDTVYVLEKCDDGWYVGSSERTGAFGTFPGNYVEKI